MKRNLVGILLLFLLLPIGIFAQELSYYKTTFPSESLEEVINKEFTAFKGKINKGAQSGVYWVKVENGSKDVVCELTSAHLKQVKCFVNGGAVSSISGSVFRTFKVPANETAYLKITCEKEAFIPVKLVETQLFNQLENKSLLSSGLYYGFTLMVIVMNLFYFFSMKEKSFLHYSIFLFFISAAIFQRDGFLQLFFGGDFYISTHLEILTHFFVAVSGTVFAIDYLNMESYWKHYKLLLFSLNGLILLSFLLFLGTDEFFWLKVSEVLTISILIIIWVTGVFMFRKNNYSKIFVLAYCAILFMAFDFFISPLMGWANLGITTKYLKIGGIVEMLLLSYAVVYRMRVIHKDHKVMVKQLYAYTNQLNSLEEELEKLNAGKENEITTDVLSSREIEILELIAAGRINKEIAEELFISINTVKYHTKKLYAKLNIKSRSEIQPSFLDSLS